MAIYSVHAGKPGKGPESIAFVREGFSFPAFILTFIWALWNRMWMAAAVLFAAQVAIGLIGMQLGSNQPIASWVAFAIAVIFGFEAKALKVKSLEAAGQPQIGIVEAETLEEAEMKFFAEGRGDIAFTSAAPVSYAPQHTQSDPLGLFGNV